MRHLVLFMHVSLDGYVAGPKGEMDWINVNEEMFEYAGQRTRVADTALYGRVTYQMMEAYWPTAADQPNPTRHDIEHSKWYNAVDKVVISTSLGDAKRANIKIVRQNIVNEIKLLKQSPGNEIIMFGSPSVAHLMMAENLVDDYWLFINPVILGQGIPLFGGAKEKISLTLAKNVVFPSGVVCLHYTYNQEKPGK